MAQAVRDGGCTADGGNGGSGGIGVHFTSSAAGATFTNSGTVVGGTGGAAGTGGLVFGGQGGVGVVGEGLTIINSGTIARGTNGAGSLGLPANAITFTGGTNVLELRAGSTITGVVQAGSADTLRLGGTTASSFNVSNIGLQYRDFGQFEKTGTSTWTLTGSTSTTTNWRVSAGTLQISSEGNLGGAGSAVVLGGGTLRTTADFTVSRLMLLDSGTNTINTAGGTELTWSGLIDGPGSLRKAGNGILILEGAKTYGGGTTVAAGTLQLGTAGGSAGSITGAVVVAFAGSLDVANGDLTGATITNTGFTSIRGGSTAGTATIDNNGFLFIGESGSAGSATINNAGSITFSELASAGSANIVTLAGGFLLSFADSSSAANATITVQNGSLVQLVNGSGGQARFIIEARRPVRHVGRRGQHGGLDRGRRRLLPGRQPAHGRQQQPVGQRQRHHQRRRRLRRHRRVAGQVGTRHAGAVGGQHLFRRHDNQRRHAFDLGEQQSRCDHGRTCLQRRHAAIQCQRHFGAPDHPQRRRWHIDTNGNNLGVAGVIAGPGGLTKTGAGILTFGAKTYSGGTTVNAGTLRCPAPPSLSAARSRSTVALSSPTATPVRWARCPAPAASSPAARQLDTDSSTNTTLASQITGTGSCSSKAAAR